MILLVVVAVLSAVVAVWGVQMLATDQGIMTEGEPTEEQLWQLRMIRVANFVPPIGTFVGVAAVLGILVIASASRSRTAHPDPRG
ncbi:hypothetical protein [Agromyces sp. Root1464]|uniref:hypothetical protein n=1 Tax=Agromyces sp. Root1464 TaxID=1736467 RepID=UPI00070144CD|nr:hypothetical protein [Agromyces sp. Root1464]